MRMRKKRHLDERLAQCGAVLLARGKPCRNLKEAAEHYRALIDFEGEFGNRNSVHLEVGCGNGGFAAALALREPDINLVAVELCSNVIVTAAERVLREGISNVRFLNIPAEILPCYIPAGSVDVIYLNFSTPLPETSRARQRLTSPRFLAIYHELLRAGGRIVQKTDSAPFFDYSLEQYEQNGFRVVQTTRDLARSEWAGENIITEYEENFMRQGIPICRAVAVKCAREERI